MVNSRVTAPSIEQEFIEIYKSYSDTLRDQLFFKFGNFEKAKDVTQDSFAKLWDKRNKISNKNIKGYLYVISANAFLNDIKHQKVVYKYQSQKVSKTISSMGTPEYILEEKEFQIKLESSISKLPVKQRDVFLMSRIDKKTHQEIATELNLSKKTIEKRIQLAKVSLKESVGVDI